MPAPAKGGIYFSIEGCSTYVGAVGKINEDGVADPPNPNQAPPGQAAPWPGTRLDDGEQGTSVSCSVSGSGPFNISATLTGVSTGATVGNHVHLSLTGGSLAEDAEGIGNISLSEPGGSYQSAEPCSLSSVGPNLQIASGYVFATFDCPMMNRLSSPAGSPCRATGAFVFERCHE